MIKKVSFLLLLIGCYSKIFSQQWSSVGEGIDGSVLSLKSDSNANRLYVGGRFTNAGSILANNIAYWDGISWNCIGTNSEFKGVSPIIQAIAIYNGDLIVAGKFDSIDNTLMNNIARWDGNNWQNLGLGLQPYGSEVNALEIFNGDLIVAGDFFNSGNDTLRNIARWNGSSWMQLSKGLNSYVNSLCNFQNKIIVGGTFNSAFLTDSTSLISPHTIAWDGISWTFFGGNLPHDSYDFEIYNDTLLSCGQSGVNYYNGFQWQGFPSPTGGAQPWTIDLKVYNDSLYACGYFNIPPEIGKYNGVGYDSICDVFGLIDQMEVFQDDLYIAGWFSLLNGDSINSIAKYNLINKIDEFTQSKKYLIYPNPFQKSSDQSLVINCPNFKSVEILTLNGQSILKANVSTIDLSKFNGGVYILNISLKDETKTYLVPLIVN